MANNLLRAQPPGSSRNHCMSWPSETPDSSGLGNSTQGGADFPKSKGSSSNNDIRLTYFFKKIIEFSGETLVNKII